jgi:transposase-like protein
MPAAVPLPIRRAILRRLERGDSVAEVAAAFGLAPRTVRGIRQRGEARLEPAPPRPPALDPSAHPAYAPALHLRREHPGWGAGLIRVMLRRQGLAPLPATRTLQRWFSKAGLGPAPPGRRPEARRRRATRPHGTWQVDAAEDIPLADGSRVCWLRIVDEFTGAVLLTAVFPPRAVECGPAGGDPAGPPRRLRPPRPARGDPRR